MIIIELSYDTDNPRGGRPIQHVVRKAFSDFDVEGVNEFLNKEPEEKGWYHRSFDIQKF